MVDYINFWLAKAYVDLVVGLGIFGLIVIIFIVLAIISWVRKL